MDNLYRKAKMEWGVCMPRQLRRLQNRDDEHVFEALKDVLTDILSDNWLIDSNNKQFKNLFFGISGATAAGYIGQLSIDAVKDVQVKKYNAQTELNLQSRLVATELRNFKSKKDSSIQPLCDEFYRQKADGKPKEELKVVAYNILNEIKNGAPYVYS